MESGSMNTAFLLMAQYGGKAIIPIEDVCRDYFSHLNPTKLVQKISAGEIAIPLVRMEASQKCAKGVHLLDLAKYLDARVEAATNVQCALVEAHALAPSKIASAPSCLPLAAWLRVNLSADIFSWATSRVHVSRRRIV